MNSATVPDHERHGMGFSRDALESIYESALCFELHTALMVFKRQIGVPLFYKGMLLSEHRPDLVVAGAVIVEVPLITTLCLCGPSEQAVARRFASAKVR